MNWKNVQIVPTFVDQGVSCYQLEGGDFKNEYYIVSEAETRKLLNNPEIVGYETYYCLIPSTSQMLYYFKEQKKVTTANILSILRGALNYPLEESCYREHIRVHDISFLSSERVFHEDEIAGLEIKYSKLTMVPGSTLLIGDIIATGETLIHCLRYVTDFYRAHGAKLRNIIIFTIGGTKGIEILERLTEEIREYWPDFEGFITVFYEGIFATYQDKGVSGINLPDVDFYWKGGIIAPEFRRQTLSMCNPLFEKYPGVEALADADVADIEEIVRPCGLGKSKARDISACMKMLRDEFDGKVPKDFNALLKLPGVGRKSANLIMGDVFGQPAIVTDTHCIRLVNRMGLVDGIKEPKKVEMELWKIIPPEEGSDFCHRLVLHGREVCTARTQPYCDKCCLNDICKKRI